MSDEIESVVREQGSYVFDRMFGAVEKVRERFNRSCSAWEQAKIPDAVIGGNAVAAWVATVDDGAVRNTRDVDILLKAEDLGRATQALESVGFVRDSVVNVTVFLDGEEGKPSQGINILLAGIRIKPEYSSPAPDVIDSLVIEGKRIVALKELVEMKLNSFRLKDRVHLIDMIQVGLIDPSWPAKFDPALSDRLKMLLDNPEG
jgi:hypothetical protein